MFGLSPAQMIIFISRDFISIRYKKNYANAGSDLGAAVKGFKKAMSDDEPKKMRNLLKLKTVQQPLKKLKL